MFLIAFQLWRERLNPIKNKWREFGIRLGVPEEKFERFKNKKEPLSEVIAYWLWGHIKDKPVTWWYIVYTLKKVDEPALAAVIEAKYYTQGEIIILHSSKIA